MSSHAQSCHNIPCPGCLLKPSALLTHVQHAYFQSFMFALAQTMNASDGYLPSPLMTQATAPLAAELIARPILPQCSPNSPGIKRAPVPFPCSLHALSTLSSLSLKDFVAWSGLPTLVRSDTPRAAPPPVAIAYPPLCLARIDQCFYCCTISVLFFLPFIPTKIAPILP